MKVTKYEHACLDVVDSETRIVICPGVFSKSLTEFTNITAIVITHEHADHFDKEKIANIIAVNPNVQIFTTSEVSKQLTHKYVTVPETEKTYTAGQATLEFFGELHAVIDPETSVVENIGVLVSGKLYYPGDSFTECPKPFEILAVPSSAPWLRIGETIPIIKNSQCNQVFPTHDALLSDIGHATTDNWLEKFATRSGKAFKYLKPGESIEI